MHSSRLKTVKILLFTLGQIILVAYLDLLTGLELGFFVFYFIPIAYASWRLGMIAAATVPLLCAGFWFAVDALSGHVYTSFLFGIWNGLVRFAAFLLLGLTVGKMRELLRKEKELSAQLQETIDQVQELQGLLPICAACKKIRNDTGYWEQMESYISRHSRAEFSHGICPECARKLYPEIFKRKEEEGHNSGISDSRPVQK